MSARAVERDTPKNESVAASTRIEAQVRLAHVSLRSLRLLFSSKELLPVRQRLGGESVNGSQSSSDELDSDVGGLVDVHGSDEPSCLVDRLEVDLDIPLHELAGESMSLVSERLRLFRRVSSGSRSTWERGRISSIRGTLMGKGGGEETHEYQRGPGRVSEKSDQRGRKERRVRKRR